MMKGETMKTLIKNVNIVTRDKIIENGYCLIENDLISYVGNERVVCDTEIDGNGGYLMPGFIDLHCHGGDGYDFMDATPEQIAHVADFHLSHGTTTMLVTTLADAPDATKQSIENFGKYAKSHPNGSLVGLHLEGPWFSAEQCGAQPTEFFRDPSASELEELKEEYPYILRVSAAPELDGAMEFGNKGRELGVVVSAAHTDADFATIEKASQNGYTLMTHLYSGMKGVTRKNAYRIAGAVEAGLYLDNLFVEIIADGKHLPIELLKFIYKFKGADRICLVTDASRACGMPDGTKSFIGSTAHGNPIIIEDGVAKLPDRLSFAGSVATFDRLVRTMYEAIGDDPVALAKMASTTPAAVMGFDDRGEIATDKRADLVIADKHYNVQKVIFNGEPIS